MTGVASGLIDHVNEDPSKVDRSDPERWERGNVVERIASREREAASFARQRIELGNAVDRVTVGQPCRTVGIVGAGEVPWWGHLDTEQPALEPAVLGPCQVLDDARDRQIGRGQKARRGVFPMKVDERRCCEPSVQSEALHQRRALVLGLEIRMLGFGARHRPILTACRPRRRLPGAAVKCRLGAPVP